MSGYGSGGIRWWLERPRGVGELGDFDEGELAEGGGDGGGEIGGNEEGNFVISGGEAFAEFDRREEVALAKKG